MYTYIIQKYKSPQIQKSRLYHRIAINPDPLLIRELLDYYYARKS